MLHTPYGWMNARQYSKTQDGEVYNIFIASVSGCGVGWRLGGRVDGGGSWCPHVSQSTHK